MSSEKKQILLIEDERSIAENIVAFLTLSGFQILWKQNAFDGLQAARSEQLALVILDIGLPDMSGFTVCKEIRNFSNIPILFLTARSSESDRIVGFEFGADDYLTKPFSHQELLLRIQAILRRTQGQNVLTKLGAYELNTEKMKIHFRQKALELSRYEYKILELFLKRPGVVYTREKLMEIIWQDPAMSLERTVDSHIKTLRAKLKSAGASENVIVTHRGTGYSFSEDADENS